jgi:polyisoprenoid-binding protein YceI
VSLSPPLLLHRQSPVEIEPCQNNSRQLNLLGGNTMKSFLVLALAVILGPAALAQHQTFAVNPDASDVKMKLNTTHEVVNGTFHIQSGSINFDRAASHISGIVIVAAGSGKTGNDSRDKKMNKDILKVEQYTTVSFAPKTYTGTIAPSGDSTIQVSGVFTLLGTPHDLTIPMQIHLDGSKATAKAQFVIPYVQWGLKNPSFMFWKADNDVAIDLNLVGQVSN